MFKLKPKLADSASEYLFTNEVSENVQDAEYITLLLQQSFDPLKKNIFLFINQQPTIYSADNIYVLEDYFNHEEREKWYHFLEQSLYSGCSKVISIRNLRISGQSVGNSYIISTEHFPDISDSINFLEKNLRSISKRAEQYKQYCDLIQDPFWIRDKNLTLIFVNHAFLNLVNASDLEAVQESNLWICNKVKSDIIAAQALQKNEPQNLHVPYVKNGQTLFGNISETPVIDDDGTVFLFGRLQDKHEEKILKDRVNNLESAVKEILTNISVAASLFDENRRLRFYNKPFMDLWGFDADYLDTAPDHIDILDKLRAKRLLPESRDFKAWKTTLFAPYHDIKQLYEDIWHTPQQKTIKCTISAYTEGGVVCLQEDVSDHIALEHSHTTLSQNLKNTLNALDEGILLCDSDGKIKVVNKKINDFFQQDIDINNHFSVLCDCLTPDNELTIFVNKIYHFIQTGFPEQEKYTEECFVDDNIYVATAMRLSTSDLLIHIRDQTTAINYQMMLHDKADSLKENEHIRESFFRRISHNLRDPMTSVAGFAEMLQTEIFGKLNEKQREYIADMRYSIDDLLRLTDNLADLVRLDSHNLSESTPISLNEITASAVKAMQNEAFAKNITLKRHSDLADDFKIKGDHTLLRQSLIQLLENAIMVTPRHSAVTIDLKQEDDQVIIKISDQGKGMPSELIHAINNGYIHEIKGYGLRYILRVTELHQSSYYVHVHHNDANQVTGSCFHICFALNQQV